jgi:hypothetical protein
MCKPVDMCVDARRLSDKGTIDAQRCSASLLTDILFERLQASHVGRAQSPWRVRRVTRLRLQRYPRAVSSCDAVHVKSTENDFRKGAAHPCSLTVAQTYSRVIKRGRHSVAGERLGSLTRVRPAATLDEALMKERGPISSLVRRRGPIPM